MAELTDEDLDLLNGDLTAVGAPLHDPVDWRRVSRGVRWARVTSWREVPFWALATWLAADPALGGGGVVAGLILAFCLFRLAEESVYAYRGGLPIRDADGEELFELLEREYREARRHSWSWVFGGLLGFLFFGFFTLFGKHPFEAGVAATFGLSMTAFSVWRLSTMQRFGPEVELPDDSETETEEGDS